VTDVDGQRCTGTLEESGQADGLPSAGDLISFDNRHVTDVRA
jgi:hypothetical protein